MLDLYERLYPDDPPTTHALWPALALYTRSPAMLQQSS